MSISSTSSKLNSAKRGRDNTTSHTLEHQRLSPLLLSPEVPLAARPPARFPNRRVGFRFRAPPGCPTPFPGPAAMRPVPCARRRARWHSR